MIEFKKMPSGIKEKLLSCYKRINDSIYYRFNFVMISLTVSILLIIGLLSFGFMRHFVVQNIRQTLESDTVHASEGFEHAMNLISESLTNISANLIITNAIVDTAGRDAYIVPFMKSFKLPNDISVKLTLCDFMGKPLASNVRNPREFNSPELLRKTIEEGKGFVELVKNDNETGLLMALPVIWVITNKPEGILVAEISLDEVFAKTLLTFNISAGQSISLLSGNTLLLQKNKKAEASFFQLKKPLRLSPPLDKMALHLEINNYRKIQTGWLVGLYCVAGLLFISVSLWVSKKLSLMLTDRLMILSDATKRIAESGSLDFTAEVKGSDEVTALAIAFNVMIGKVRESRDSLEMRVEELRSVTQRLKLSTQSANLGIWDWDINNNHMLWDDRMFELYGLTRETFSGGFEAWQNSLHQEDRDKTIEEFQAALRGEKEWNTDFRILHPNGTPKYIKANGIVIRDSEGTPVRMLGINFDITERKQAEAEKAELERQNRQLQKAESLGRMAGAIAHHFNNQLGVVIGNLELAMMELPQGARPRANITSAMKASNKAAEMSGLMLTYLGQSFDKSELLDLSEICRRSLPLLQAVMPGNVALETDLPSPGPAISTNTNYIQQVMTNLITNAREAIGEGRGTINLSVKKVFAANIPAMHRFPLDWQPQDNAYACLEVADEGCGIEDKDIEKLFDPFFSSKFTGRGMGLAVVMGIVRTYKGVVTVESEPGRGSTFRVFLPVSGEEVLRQPEKA